MNIVVVELPSKAKTINKYLGPGYEVLASFGHVRDLPPKDGSVDPENDFRMLWEVDAKSSQRLNDIARARQRRRQADPRHRPGSRRRSDLLARARGAEGKECAQGPEDRARRVQRHHQAGGDRGDEASARDRWRIGRCLPRPPRARLSRRLHALAGALAKIAGRALGRPGAIGRVAAGLRPRAGDREIRRQRNTGRSSPTWRPRATKSSKRGWSAPTGKRSSASTSAPAPKPKPSTAISRTPPSRSFGRSQARPAQSAAALHHLDHAAGSEPQARLCAGASPCASRSGSMKASRSTARPSA